MNRNYEIKEAEINHEAKQKVSDLDYDLNIKREALKSTRFYNKYEMEELQKKLESERCLATMIAFFCGALFMYICFQLFL